MRSVLGCVLIKCFDTARCELSSMASVVKRHPHNTGVQTHSATHSIEHVPRVNFSPESGGRVKPSNAIDEISTQGTMRLKK